MKLISKAESQLLDEKSEAEYDLSREVLMESAGALAAREIEVLSYPELRSGTVAIICGDGHNGADGFVVARHMQSRGYDKLAIFYNSQGVHSELWKLQFSRLKKLGLTLVDYSKNRESIDEIQKHSLIVDALFGVGLNRPIEGPHKKIVQSMNSAKALKVSLDVPSGLCADRGIVLGQAVKADYTLTFALAKPGFFVAQGPEYVGRLKQIPIGFPQELIKEVACHYFAFDEKLARKFLPRRSQTSNKSDAGHLLLAAGSKKMLGAGILSANAAARIGAGYVSWGSFDDLRSQLTSSPEVIFTDLNGTDFWQNKKINAVAVGPGLGVNERTANLIRELKKRNFKNVILDADALTCLSEFRIQNLPASWILTPHTGELSRILQISVDEINQNKFQAARLASQKTGALVLLKGFRTIIADQRHFMVILSGNAALAKAGSGDVLTGFIGGLLAQGLSSLKAASLGAYLHGRLADEWIRRGHDQNALLPSDLKDDLPILMKLIRSGGEL